MERAWSYDIGISRAVNRYAAANFITRAADVAAVKQRGSRGIYFGHKGIARAIVRQVGTDGHRERGLSGFGVACDIGISITVNRYAVAIINTRAADVAAVKQRGSRGIDLGHKGIAVAAVECQVRTVENRERGLSGIGIACDIGISRLSTAMP